ncbi:F-box/kelch-repeat protein At3g06240-like [Juglans microcarpa x Juglans regia]|uniref:F-box/kelch-repeat protein At3g06240-like n=1 Tax=Juglans microcarpa x Juglans regia TaxID=2249226 RepID=UPI001B7F77A2|nr:F-box/kelch-repeat protein At3g06240-like [Juglans microcarpa x Juglans regia]
MSTKYLPENVIVEILLRLPVKSLVRFRCVSKRWRSLISDPRFAKSQFSQASERSQRLLISSRSEILSLDYNAPFGDSSTLREHVVPSLRRGRHVRIVGSCNGLVCVAVHRHKGFRIWNPSTGDVRKLPDPKFSLRGEDYWYGFGFDPSTDDYKLLVASFLFLPRYQESEGKLFSLKRNSWKTILQGVDASSEAKESTGILCNGSLHWQLELWEELDGVWVPECRDQICVFDLAEEKFHEMLMPVQVEDRYKGIFFCSLRNLGGCLCFISYNRTHIELWRMMEYGVRESWALMLSIAYFHVRISRHNLAPVCISRDGQVVAINDGKELLRCNSDGEILEHVLAFSDSRKCKAAVFVESLISPNHYSGVDGQGQRLFSDEDDDNCTQMLAHLTNEMQNGDASESQR